MSPGSTRGFPCLVDKKYIIATDKSHKIRNTLPPLSFCTTFSSSIKYYNILEKMIKTSSNKKNINKYLLVCIFVILILFISTIYRYKKSSYFNSSSKQSVDDSEVIHSNHYSINNFEIVYTKLDRYNFKAIPNFGNKYTSQEIIDNSKCNVIFNGAFYMKNLEPLGLYYYDQQQYGDIKKSDIYNGIISLNNDRIWEIIPSSTYSFNKSSLFVTQSGPILVLRSKLTNVPTNEGLGRRVVFTLDKNNNPSILVIYNRYVLNDGPNIRDLIDMIKILINEKGIDIYDAINLDGGNSSLYIDNNVSLKENTFPGSYFCFHE